MAQRAREKSLNRAHSCERKMRDVVRDTLRDAREFFTKEMPQFNMRQNKFNSFDLSIKTSALAREYAVPAVSHNLIVQENPTRSNVLPRIKIRYAIIIITDRNTHETGLLRIASPNFCVASLRRSRTILVSSLMNGCSRGPGRGSSSRASLRVSFRASPSACRQPLSQCGIPLLRSGISSDVTYFGSVAATCIASSRASAPNSGFLATKSVSRRAGPSRR